MKILLILLLCLSYCSVSFAGAFWEKIAENEITVYFIDTNSIVHTSENGEKITCGTEISLFTKNNNSVRSYICILEKTMQYKRKEVKIFDSNEKLIYEEKENLDWEFIPEGTIIFNAMKKMLQY